MKKKAEKMEFEEREDVSSRRERMEMPKRQEMSILGKEQKEGPGKIFGDIPDPFNLFSITIH